VPVCAMTGVLAPRSMTVNASSRFRMLCTVTYGGPRQLCNTAPRLGRLRSGLDLEVAAANVFDQNYQLHAGYPEPGRIVSVNLRYRF
jgi:hypothetical protein